MATHARRFDWINLGKMNTSGATGSTRAQELFQCLSGSKMLATSRSATEKYNYLETLHLLNF